MLIAILALAAVSAAGTWFALASAQQDFAAYWVAGRARRLGLDPYLNHLGSAAAPALWDGAAYFRHSRFLYPPLVAELFRPLAALPFQVAKAIFTGLSVAALCGGAALAAGAAGRPGRGGRIAAFLAAGALFFPVYLQLERGQVDLLLLPLLVLAWQRRDRPGAAGAALALAGMFKPALLGALPVIAALGRRRWAVATVAFGLGLVGLTALVSGPAAVASYAGEVLPRAALFGEGGTEEMLLPPDRSRAADPSVDEARGAVSIDGRWYRLSSWDSVVPWTLATSASLPRLLAPTVPSPLTSLGPYLIAAALLTWAARRLAARYGSSNEGATEETLFGCAVLLACVVTSPAGWTMSFVWALPVTTAVATLRARGPADARLGAPLALAWLACAIPPPAAGWGALAGSALAIAAAAAAVQSAGQRPADEAVA